MKKWFFIRLGMIVLSWIILIIPASVVFAEDTGYDIAEDVEKSEITVDTADISDEPDSMSGSSVGLLNVSIEFHQQTDMLNEDMQLLVREENDAYLENRTSVCKSIEKDLSAVQDSSEYTNVSQINCEGNDSILSSVVESDTKASDNTIYSGKNNLSGTDSDDNSDLIEYEAHVDLIQDGGLFSQYFGPEGISSIEYSDDLEESAYISDDWSDTLRARISDVMTNTESMVYISDLGINKKNDIDKVRLIYRSCIKGDRFYISGSFSYYCDSAGNISKIKVGYYSAFRDDDDNPDAAKINTYLDEFYENASVAVEYAAQGRDKLEQLLLAHDWIVRECDYDYESYAAGSIPAQSYNAYGCFVKRKAVCNGYALAYSYILEALGYDSYIIASTAMNHAWNMVSLDSNWLHVDTTWDDPVFKNGLTYYHYPNDDHCDEGLVLHKYFLRTDQEMKNMSHYKWKLQNSELDLPESPDENPYEGAIFDLENAETEFVLFGNRWYFSKDDELYSSQDLWGNDLQKHEVAGIPVHYLHQFSDQLIFTDFQNIYCLNIENAELYIWLETTGTVSELGVKQDKAFYVLTDGIICDEYLLEEEEIPGGICLSDEEPECLIIRWNSVENATGYILYRSEKEDGSYVQVNMFSDKTTVSYTDNVAGGKTYFYKMQSYRVKDEEGIYYSEHSDVVSGTALINSPREPANSSKDEGISVNINIKINKITSAEVFVGYKCPIRHRGIGRKGGEYYSDSSSVSENMALLIIKQPESVSAEYGDIVTFNVEAENADSYQWYYQEEGSSEWYKLSANTKESVLINGSTSDTLKIKVTRERMTYQYRCMVRGKDGSAIFTDEVGMIL